MLDSSSEYFLEQGPGHAADRYVLVGVDAPITAATQYTLHTVDTFFAPYTAHLHLLVLTVIPLPYSAGRHAAYYPSSPTREEQMQAEETLRTACAALQHNGMSRAQIETLVRVGTPADELARVANKRHVDCIVIGSRGNSLGQRIRRWFLGSTSRRVLHLAPCPVMVVTLPRSCRVEDLVAWYEAAILQALHDQPPTLVIFTPREVARRFLPPQMLTAGRRERTAAALALERLELAGILCRRHVQGEVCYLND